MRAQSPVVNVTGDHATCHRRYDASLTSGVEGTARPFSHWVRTTPDADSVAENAAAAIAAARTAPGRVVPVPVQRIPYPAGQWAPVAVTRRVAGPGRRTLVVGCGICGDPVSWPGSAVR